MGAQSILDPKPKVDLLTEGPTVVTLAYPNQSRKRKPGDWIQTPNYKGAGLFYRNLEDHVPVGVAMGDDEQTADPMFMVKRTQEPRALTRLFSNPMKDMQHAVRAYREDDGDNVATEQKIPREALLSTYLMDRGNRYRALPPGERTDVLRAFYPEAAQESQIQRHQSAQDSLLAAAAQDKTAAAGTPGMFQQAGQAVYDALPSGAQNFLNTVGPDVTTAASKVWHGPATIAAGAGGAAAGYGFVDWLQKKRRDSELERDQSSAERGYINALRGLRSVGGKLAAEADPAEAEISDLLDELFEKRAEAMDWIKNPVGQLIQPVKNTAGYAGSKWLSLATAAGIPTGLAAYKYVQNNTDSRALQEAVFLRQQALQMRRPSPVVLTVPDEQQPDPSTPAPATPKFAASAASGQEILDTKGWGGAIADVMMPRVWGGTRAGRAEQLATATGDETPFNVRHPLSSDVLQSLKGLGIGGLLGAGVGAGAGALLGQHRGDVAAGAGLGGLLGGLGGATVSGLANGFDRRKNIRGIVDKFDQVRAEDPDAIQPKAPEFNSAATILAPLRGEHRAGQAEAYRAMMTGEPVGSTGRNLGYLSRIPAQLLAPGGGDLVAMLQGWQQNATAPNTVLQAQQPQAA